MQWKPVSTKTCKGIQRSPLSVGHLERHGSVPKAPVRHFSYKMRRLYEKCCLLSSTTITHVVTVTTTSGFRDNYKKSVTIGLSIAILSSLVKSSVSCGKTGMGVSIFPHISSLLSPEIPLCDGRWKAKSSFFFTLLLLSHFSRAQDCDNTNCFFTHHPPETCSHTLTLPPYQLTSAIYW